MKIAKYAQIVKRERYCAGDLPKIESDELKVMDFFAGEKDQYCFVDSTEGKHTMFRGGNLGNSSIAGLFYSELDDSRSNAYALLGGRSDFYKKNYTLSDSEAARRD